MSLRWFFRADLRTVSHNRSVAVRGDQINSQGSLVISVEVSPVHGDDSFGALTQDEGNPGSEQGPYVELGIAQESIDLFDSVLDLKTFGHRQAATDGMNGIGGRMKDPGSGIGYRGDAREV